MRTILVAILLATGMAGCADAPEPNQQVEPVQDGNSTVEPPVAVESAALVSADVLNGTVPLSVNFTIEANGTWDLDFGDGNATSGSGDAVIAHTYTQAGSYEAKLGNATILIDALAGSLPSGSLIQTTEWTEDGRLLVALTAECGVQDGVDRAEHTWSTAGLLPDNYMVANIVLVIDEEDTAVDVDIDLLNAEGANIGASHSFNPLAGPGETITSSGPHAPGDFTVIVAGCTGADMGYVLTATADLVAA